MADDDDDIDMEAALAEIAAEEEAKKKAAAAASGDDDDLDMAAALAEIEAAEAKKKPAAAAPAADLPARTINKEAVYDVPVEISVVLGKADLRVHQLLKLGRGAVVELDRRTDEPVDVFADNILIARGEVTVTDDDKLGVALTEIVRSLFTRA